MLIVTIAFYISSLIVEDSINLDANSDPLSAAVTLRNLFFISFMMVIPLQGSTSKGKCFTRFLFSFFFRAKKCNNTSDFIVYYL